MVFIVYQETAGFQQFGCLCLILKSNKTKNALRFQIVVCRKNCAQTYYRTAIHADIYSSGVHVGNIPVRHLFSGPLSISDEVDNDLRLLHISLSAADPKVAMSTFRKQLGQTSLQTLSATDQASLLVVINRLIHFIHGVHDKGTVLNDRFIDRSGRQQ